MEQLSKKRQLNLRILFATVFLGGMKVTVHVLNQMTEPGSPKGYFVIKRRVFPTVLERFAKDGEIFAIICSDPNERLHSEFRPGFRLGDKSFKFTTKETWTSLMQQWRKPLPDNIEEAVADVMKYFR